MRAQEFLESLSGKVTLIFHNDGDGVCSATLIYDYLKSRGLEVRLFSGDIEKRTFQNARVSENIIMTDLAIDQYPEFIEKFKDKNILIIDHHPVKSDLNEVGFIHINPRIKEPDKYISASEICYDILKDITKPKEWLMKVGGVSDCSLKGSRREEKAAHMIAAIKAVKKSIYLSELVEYLSTCPSLNDFLVNKEFKKINKIFQDEIKRVMDGFKKEKYGDPVFFMIDSKYPMKSVISNILFEKYPKKTIFICKESNNTYNISARSNNIDVGKLLKKITEGIGHGGGHCLCQDTLIQLENGALIQIKNADRNKMKNINLDKLSFNSERCIHLFKNDKNVIYRINASPYRLECSSNHTLFAFRDNMIKEIKTKELKISDFLLGLKTINIKGQKQKIPVPILQEYVKLNPTFSKIIKSRIIKKYKNVNKFRNKLNDDWTLINKFINARKYIERDKYIKLLNELNLKFNDNHIQIRNVHNIKKYTKLPKFLNSEIAQIIGYYIGDGSKFHNKGLEFKDESHKILSDYNNLFKKTFNDSGVIIKVSKKNCYKLRIYNTAIYSIFAQMGILEHNTNIIEKSPSNVVSKFIGGFFDAEGTIGNHEIKIGNTDKLIIRRLQLLLLRFGILSSIDKNAIWLSISDFSSIKKFKEHIKFFHLEKNKKLNILILKLNSKKRNSNICLPIRYKDLRNYGIKSKEYSNKFINSYKFRKDFLTSFKKKNKKLSKMLSNKNTMWCKVKKIDVINEKQPMYDLTLPNNKNFIANGLIVHNSQAAAAHVNDIEEFKKRLSKEFKKDIN